MDSLKVDKAMSNRRLKHLMELCLGVVAVSWILRCVFTWSHLCVFLLCHAIILLIFLLNSSDPASHRPDLYDQFVAASRRSFPEPEHKNIVALTSVSPREETECAPNTDSVEDDVAYQRMEELSNHEFRLKIEAFIAAQKWSLVKEEEDKCTDIVLRD